MNTRSKLLCLILTLVCMFMATDAMAKPKQTKVYVFGVSTSYTDSLTYLTDIQALSPAYVETKTGFLYDRSIYSQQLHIWIETAKEKPGTTCAIFFSKSRSRLEKKFLKLQDKLRKDPSTKLQVLNAGEFKFVPQEWSEHERL
ncbi:MAG: hypothetical protein NC113_02765 [Bacteroides sp.]|nr:hypothetical protein [Bacteroides sp.]MCM1447132.1 hypothetical protein [Bacteroides sp.]MCM1515136.1 hypothetical protein [Paraprevotella sp.]